MLHLPGAYVRSNCAGVHPLTASRIRPGVSSSAASASRLPRSAAYGLGAVLMAVHNRTFLPMLQTHEIQSTCLGAARRITVWSPSRQTPAARRPFSVLYLNDGQNLFDPARAFAGRTWRVAETAARLVRSGRIRPLIIVGIDHGDARRSREYLPVEDDRNPDAREPLGCEYVEFVTREVMPLIEGTYTAARGASNTGFGGSWYRSRGRALHRDGQARRIRAPADRESVLICG